MDKLPFSTGEYVAKGGLNKRDVRPIPFALQRIILAENPPQTLIAPPVIVEMFISRNKLKPYKAIITASRPNPDVDTLLLGFERVAQGLVDGIP